jgi:hypothetical protein
MNLTILRSPSRGASALRAALLGLITAAAVIVLSGCPPDQPVVCNGGAGRDPDNCLAFRTGAAPVIDGNPSDDSWISAFRYVLGDGNGTAVPHATAQGMRTSDAIYLSFEVNNDPTFDLDDAIVLAFDPDGNASNHRRIHIFPVFPAGAGAGGVPQAIQYWKDSASPQPWTDPGRAPDPTPTWLSDNIRVTSDDSGTSKHWRVEIKIPIVANANDPGINLPSNDDFGFYFSVLVAETVNNVTNLVAEESWPLNTNVGAFIENTPVVGSWGNGIFGLRNNGVSIASISTDQPNPLHIEIDQPNVFRCDVENRMTDVNGSAVVANNVQVTFRLKNFGIPGHSPWEQIPTGNNPQPPHNIPAGNPGTYQFQTSPWTVPVVDRPKYLANPNQCLRAELDTTGPDTLLVNRRGMINTVFVDTASPFKENAAVNTAAAEPAPDQRELEFLLQEFRYNTEAEAPWSTELAGAQQVGDRVWNLRALPGPDARLDTVITPPPITIPVERVMVPPGKPGQAQRIAVRPGNLITLVAQGSILRGDREIRPNGADLSVQGQGTPPGAAGAPRAAQGAKTAKGKIAEKIAKKKGYDGGGTGGGTTGGDKYPLPAEDSPETRIGALVGSFDGFSQRAFVIGRAATVMVPAGAQELSLGTNDTEEGWRQQTGNGYQLEVIQTPADGIYRYTTSQLPKEPPRGVLHLPLGQNLPTWILCGMRRTGQTVTIHSKVYQRYDRWGCYSYTVKSIGHGEPGEPPPPDTTATPPGAAAGGTKR